MDQRLRVYFTVDTESSMGGAWLRSDRAPLKAERHVFCRIDGKDHGIPLLVRIMGEFGFRATYFIETLSTKCLGDKDTASIFEYLLREGQDVQLHIHPNFHFYALWKTAHGQGTTFECPKSKDFIGHLTEKMQIDLLNEAAQIFERFAGFRPTAFRAGCFAGSRSMMRCLHKLGIQVDSSFNPCYHPQLSFPDGPMTPNLVQKIEGVWEIPVTVAYTKLPEGSSGYKFADCTALSFAEIRSMLNDAASNGQTDFVIAFHSFSAVKSLTYTYTKLRPNHIVIRRLRKLFQYLAENRHRFCVETMNMAGRNLLGTEPSQPFIPELGFCNSAARKMVQLWNNLYWT